jgi:hypothetical protein
VKDMLSRVDPERKIRSRKQKTDVGKYYLVNGTAQLWNELPEDAYGHSAVNQVILGKSVGK